MNKHTDKKQTFNYPEYPTNSLYPGAEIWIFCDTNYLHQVRSLDRSISNLDRLRQKKENAIKLGILDFTLTEIIQKVKERNEALKKSFIELYSESDFDFAKVTGVIRKKIEDNFQIIKIEDCSFREGAHRAMVRKPPAHKKKELFDSIFWEGLLKFSSIKNNNLICFLTANSNDFDMKKKDFLKEALESRICVFHSVGDLGNYLDKVAKHLKQEEEEIEAEAREEDNFEPNDEFEEFPENVPNLDLKNSDSFIEALDSLLLSIYHCYRTGSVYLVNDPELIDNDPRELCEDDSTEVFKRSIFSETWRFEAMFEYDIVDYHREYTLEKSGSQAITGQVVANRNIEITSGDRFIEETDFDIDLDKSEFDPDQELSPGDDDVSMEINED